MRHCDFMHKKICSSDVRQMRINATDQENLRREMCTASCSFLCVFSGKLIKCVTLFFVSILLSSAPLYAVFVKLFISHIYSQSV